MFRMGTAIARRYVLIGPIGYGGISVVYQSIDTVRGRNTALKMLSPQFAGDPDARLKVQHEALITDRLRSPSVPHVYDYGDAELPDGSTVPYVSMELLRGTVLAGRLVGGQLPWRGAVRIAATVADVLAVAHRRGVVHRDLTPENIMITKSGPQIIDFGAAVTVDGPSALAHNHPLPSRRVSGSDSPADDVYALGVLLYHMLTGRSPYGSAVRSGDRAAPRQHRAAPTPVLLVPDMPRLVAEICRASMAKRAEDRPGSAEVAIALWGVLTHTAHRGVPSPPGPLTALPRAADPGRHAVRGSADRGPADRGAAVQGAAVQGAAGPGAAVAGRSVPYSTVFC
jgi:serine/threonine protein kinase